MRVRLLAAAAASVLASGQAGAATFVRYTVDSYGYQVTTNTVGGEIGPRQYGSFRLTFAIGVNTFGSDGYGNTVFCSASSCSSGGPTANNFTADASQSGVLTASENYAISGEGGSERLDLSYSNPNGMSGFPTDFGDIAATGSVSQRSVNFYYNSGSVIMASVTRFNVTPASGVELLQLGVLPEPATWAMMILGMGAVGWAMRSRRVSTRVSFA